MSRRQQRLSHLSATVVAVVLAALLSGWAHAATHVEADHAGTDCAACLWAKHSPATGSAPPALRAALPAGLQVSIERPVLLDQVPAGRAQSRAPPAVSH